MVVLQTGCIHGKIGLFTVSPNPACRGEPVHISYLIEAGSPDLQANPGIPDLEFDPRERRRSDVLTIAADRDTRITLIAHGTEETDQRTIALVVRDPSEAVMISPTGTCPGPSWTQAFFENQWPEDAEVIRVTNLEPAAMTITHERWSVRLGPEGSPNASTADFSGHRLAGDWRLAPELTSAFCPPTCGLTSTPCPTVHPVHAEITWQCGAR